MRTLTINDLIQKAMTNSYSYQQYKDLVHNLLSEGKSTGTMQSDDLTNYSMLNDRRMKRLDKTIKIDAHVQEIFQNAKTNVTWLVITEGWCGDASQILPVMHKLAELNEGIDLRLVLRDENEELMNNFLTNGGQSIPKLIVWDNLQTEVVNSWGPRPSIATKMVKEYKEANGSLDAEFKQRLQLWYNKDKGKNIAEDLLKML